MRADPALAELMMLRRGSRLSITPVTASDWRHILNLLG
jgi:predicted RNA-binding protein with PUA-like domain